MEKFKSLIEVLKFLGEFSADDIGLVILHLQNTVLFFNRATDEQKQMSRDTVKDKQLAIMSILGTEKAYYGKLIEDLEN